MTESTTCPKCDGSGYTAGFDHIADGICFLCAGRGVVPEGTSYAGAPATPGQIAAGALRRQIDGLVAVLRYRAATARRFDAAVASLDPALAEPIRRLADLRPEHRLVRYLGDSHDAGPAVLAAYLGDLPGSLFGAGEVDLAVVARDALR